MLDALTVDTFAPALGDAFVLRRDGGDPLELELIEARPIDAGAPPADAGGRRAPFSLLFRGPVEPLLEQRIYALRHDRIGALEIFIVPVARDAAGASYEAIFT